MDQQNNVSIDPTGQAYESTHPDLACGFVGVRTGRIALERNSNKVKVADVGERKRRLISRTRKSKLRGLSIERTEGARTDQ